MDTLDAYPQFLELVRTRFSCRKYLPAPVSDDLVKAVLETAQLAPSAKNLQPWTFIVVDSDSALRPLVNECYNREWFAAAPVCIVACGNHSEAWHRDDGLDSTHIDVSIAVEHIALAAASLGLATCWVCNFDAGKLAEGLVLPEEVEPLVLMPLGYPDDSMPVPVKKRNGAA